LLVEERSVQIALRDPWKSVLALLAEQKANRRRILIDEARACG